ncbi:diguanylate cyclase [Devosia sp. PTR5]|uniref:Diguanylate cyclase n=2 Tax=Devosia oryzisoli TaxID=2774138 RepID=A0A927FU72_9HYPH|nr:diguanylate cyclase [Devosia oryzisoli]
MDKAALARLAAHFGVIGAGLVSERGGWIESFGSSVPPTVGLGKPVGHGIVRTDLDGIPFFSAAPIAALWAGDAYWLSLWDDRPRAAAEAATILARLEQLTAQVALDRILAADRYRTRLFERASRTARIGIWACRLPDERLTWSEGVYDLFELPRGIPVSRSLALDLYLPESRLQMQVLREQAIATRSDFALDAQIITAKGNHRWMRITAAVESRGNTAVGIFGMKQDITAEKNLAEHTRRLAETDAMTGLANRGLFQQRLDAVERCGGAPSMRALLLVDLDNFKQINDTLGHAQGDACLVETARRLRKACPPDALVARIGGDEFAVLTSGTTTDPEALAQEIVEALRPPFQLGDQVRVVGASVGLARHRGQSADALYRNADTALYAAKSGGRSTWRRYEAA